ncbi:MAG: DUF3857 domain-containing protein [Acidobacteria bacterium]|nr:DUF3857 domain-containing protein [Acidobacteriota bacterium]
MTILLAFAEILLWDTRVLPPHEITHSVRIQLSDQRDLSRHGNVVIPHEGHSLCAVKARTVLPSGAEISVSPSPLLDDGSIVFPALEPGSIIEYQYTESYAEPLSLPLSIPLQRDLPIRRRTVSYPPSWQPHYFHCDNCTADLAPLSTAPPAYLLLTPRSSQPPDEFWRSHAAQLAATFEQELAPVSPRPESDLNALAEFCRTRIKNSLYRTDNLSPADRAEPNASPAETLRRGIGTSHEINLLFAALARAAGHTVFYVRVGTPDFRREILDPAQLQNEVIAVRLSTGYAFFNPGVPYLSAGLLDADEEGQPALLATPEGPVFVTLPRSAPHLSRTERQTRLALAADGSVSGRIELTYHGLAAAARKRKAERPSATERLADIRSEYPGAQLTNISVRNIALPAVPVQLEFDIYVPNYAERSARRLFLPTNFFGAKAVFTLPPGHTYESDKGDILPIRRPLTWFQEAATAPSPTGPSAHVLLREESVVAEPSGRQTTTTRSVIRILTAAGSTAARGGIVYDATGGRVVSFRAWLVAPSGELREFGPAEFTDRAVNQGELHTSLRQRTIAVSAAVGSVFVYEAVVTTQSVFHQFEYEFQPDGLPVACSRFSLSSPAGWPVRAHLFDVQPTVAGQTWTAYDLPASSGPSPRLAITVGSAFATWSDVAEWLAAQAEPAARLTPVIAARAASLVRNQADPIRALAAFVQRLRYVAVNVNSSGGGGFVPREADAVLAQGYGDCKDKANLLRTLLRAEGIESWLVAINSTDRQRVRPEWPSPRLFNHAILAIATPDGLRYFDPSDPYVSLGDLPVALQNSPSLLFAPGARLANTPVGEVAAVERSVHLTLTADGSVGGRVLESSRGHAAAAYRARELGERVQVRDEFPGAGLHLYYEFTAGLRAAGPELLLLRPFLLADFAVPVAFHETVEITLPADLLVEELPDGAVFRGGKLVLERRDVAENPLLVLRRAPHEQSLHR